MDTSSTGAALASAALTSLAAPPPSSSGSEPDAVAELMGLIDTDATVAAGYLEMAGGTVEAALNLFHDMNGDSVSP